MRQERLREDFEPLGCGRVGFASFSAVSRGTILHLAAVEAHSAVMVARGHCAVKSTQATQAE